MGLSSRKEYQHTLSDEDERLILQFTKKMGSNVQINRTKSPRDHLQHLLFSLYKDEHSQSEASFEKAGKRLDLEMLCWLTANYSDRELDKLAMPALKHLKILPQDYNLAFSFMQGSISNIERVKYILEILDYMKKVDPSPKLRTAVLSNSKSEKFKDYNAIQAFTAEWMQLNTSSDSIHAHPFLYGPARPPFQGITMDAPLSLVAKYNGNIIMWCSFLPSKENKSAFVNQLQGAQSPKKNTSGFRAVNILNRLDFELTLIDTLTPCFRDWDIQEIIIPQAKDNKWTQTRSDGIVHLPLSRAETRYDNTRIKLKDRHQKF